ncbi:Heavy metal-associated domain, HMA, partial [Metarhizium majus ARSEF 297]
MSNLHTYEFNVAMSCGGCSGAIDRVLKKLDGVESYEVSLENQTAKVVTGLPYETVLTKIAKTGKTVKSATADGVEQSVEIPAAAA